MNVVPDALLGLAGALFGGVLVKLVDRHYRLREKGVDAEKDIRGELHEEVRLIKAELKMVREEMEEWREKYYSLLEEHLLLKSQNNELRRQLEELNRRLDRALEDPA